jgi:putative effector of murein hydrolase
MAICPAEAGRRPLAITIGFGGLVGIVSAVGVGWLLQLPQQVLLSLTTRAVTTPIAMSVSQGIGGIPELSAMFVILSGIFGAVIVKPLFGLLGLRDDMVLGIATGLSARHRHGAGVSAVGNGGCLCWPGHGAERCGDRHSGAAAGPLLH